MSDTWWSSYKADGGSRFDGQESPSGSLWHNILTPDYSAFTDTYQKRSDTRAYGNVMSSLSTAFNGMMYGKK